MKTKHKTLCATLAGALFLISNGAAYADKGQPPSETPPAKPADQQQTINQLLLRIEALEKKLGTMETKPPAEERLANIESKIEQVREESSAANIDNNFALAGYGTVSLMQERGDGGGDKTSFTTSFIRFFSIVTRTSSCSRVNWSWACRPTAEPKQTLNRRISPTISANTPS